MKRNNEFDSMNHYHESRAVVDGIIFWVTVLAATLVWLGLGA